MQYMYDELITEVERKTCDIHFKNPHIDITDGKLHLDCCCDDFKLTCYRDIIYFLKTHKRNTISGALRRV